MATGIVLGGGGILGGFQVGALKYLHKRKCLDDIACICGTSVGAVNGAIIATDDECWPVRLEHFWLDNVLTTSDLLGQQEWFTEFYSLFNKALVDTSRSRVLTLYNFIRGGVRVSRDHLFDQDSGGWGSLEELIKSVTTKNSLFTTDVLKKRLDKLDFKSAVDSDIALRFYATDLQTGTLACFANAKGMKPQTDDICLKSPEELLTGVLASAALSGVFPPVMFPPTESLSSQASSKYYVDGSMREVIPILGTTNWDLLKRYVILCTPRIPKNLKREDLHESEHACPDIAGESQIDWGKSHLLDVAIRSVEIVIDEIVDADIKENTLDTDVNMIDRSSETTVIIDPLVAVHGLTDLHIGLIKINMDQGYMRAFDEVDARALDEGDASQTKYEECRQLTRLITLQRVGIWKAEHELIERLAALKHRSSLRKLLPSPFLCSVDQAECLLRAPVDTTILYDIRAKKRDLKECVMRRVEVAGKDALPEHCEDMWRKWEQHNWDVEGREPEPFIETPWEPLDLGCRGIERIPSAPCP